MYFVPDMLALENLAILHTRNVNFLVANPTGLAIANHRFARFTAQPEIVLYFYFNLEYLPYEGVGIDRFQSQAEMVLYFYTLIRNRILSKHEELDFGTVSISS